MSTPPRNARTAMPTNKPSGIPWDFSLPDTPHGFWAGYQVFDASKNRFIDAVQSDATLIRDYPFWIDKGPPIDGTRLTLTCAKLTYAPGEPVRIAHIVEETSKERLLYIIGPKAIRDEYVNDAPLSATQNTEDYPWLPASYDGEVQPSPGIDYNFEITQYVFDEPGDYRIQWCPGRYRSNVLFISVA